MAHDDDERSLGEWRELLDDENVRLPQEVANLTELCKWIIRNFDRHCKTPHIDPAWVERISERLDGLEDYAKWLLPPVGAKAEPVACWECNGTGKVSYRVNGYEPLTCTTCKGTGKKPAPEPVATDRNDTPLYVGDEVQFEGESILSEFPSWYPWRGIILDEERPHDTVAQFFVAVTTRGKASVGFKSEWSGQSCILFKRKEA